jgi:[ribosomal protein S18]-alanine N-acetyltransferase
VIAIREFVPGDVAAILRIEHAAHPAGHWRAEDFEWLNRQAGGIVLVAQLGEGGAIAGFVAARALGPEAEMLNLAVGTEHRRQGIGRRLVEELHRHLYAAGTERVYLEVRPSNLSAQRLYRSLGYCECGRRHNYYASDGEDALVLEVRLRTESRSDSDANSRFEGGRVTES